MTTPADDGLTALLSSAPVRALLVREIRYERDARSVARGIMLAIRATPTAATSRAMLSASLSRLCGFRQ